MRPSVKERLNKKLVDNNMTRLSVEPSSQPQQRLYRNRTSDDNKCEDRLLNNRMNDGRLYGNGAYDDRVSNNRINDDYYTLQEPIVDTEPTLLRSLVTGNEQLVIVFAFGFAAYVLYLFSKSKDKP